MHRKPMVSLLVGSLVFGLVLVSISWLPEVSGWQQGTLSKKKPANRIKRSAESSAPVASQRNNVQYSGRRSIAKQYLASR